MAEVTDNIHIGAMAAVEALKQCAAKDRRIAELEAQIVAHSAAISQAKREALEAAADRFKDEVLLEEAAYLRQMAREVKG